MIIYIAGPMSGLPDNNYPAFNAEAARLRAQGYEVRNPAEGPECFSWSDYMRMSIRQLVTCDTIRLLHGWEESSGAMLEVYIADRLGMRFFYPQQEVTP